jgi:hypothetical protein
MKDARGQQRRALGVSALHYLRASEGAATAARSKRVRESDG